MKSLDEVYYFQLLRVHAKSQFVSYDGLISFFADDIIQISQDKIVINLSAVFVLTSSIRNGFELGLLEK